MPSSPWKQKYKKLSRFFNPNRKNFFNPKRKILKTVSGNCSGLFLSSSISGTPCHDPASSVSRSCLICVTILSHLCHDSASSVSQFCLICVTPSTSVQSPFALLSCGIYFSPSRKGRKDLHTPRSLCVLSVFAGVLPLFSCDSYASPFACCRVLLSQSN